MDYSTSAHPNLTAQHYEMLNAGSGIAEDVIAARGYRTATGYSELKSLGIALARDTDTRGLLIPLHTTEGKPAETFIAKADRTAPLTLYRPDAPQVGRDGHPYKYLYPGGQRMRLDCHPQAHPMLGDPAMPLWITEGIKKGDALVSHGLCAVALMGVTCWRGSNEQGGKVVLSDWQHVALNGREVRIVFDSDVAEKPEVARALQSLTQWLRSKQARVHVAYLPSAGGDKVGVDDYLLKHTVADLERLLEAPRRQNLPEATPVGMTFKLTTTGHPRPILCNALEVLTHDPRWAGVFGFDELSQVETLAHCPPYLVDTDPWTPRPVDDRDDIETANWIQTEYEVFASTTVVAEAIHMLARRSPYHPIRDYLAGLTWDKTPRLDTWLSAYCHAEDTDYTRAVGPKSLISAVARAVKPGCKVDTVAIFQGEQGLLKSTAWRILAGDEWFSDTLPEVDDKDAAQSLRGKWIIELGDLAVLQRSALEAVKRFISANQDHYRPSYGRRAVTFSRHNIFVASTNRDTYFKDETGNRRFWPITITGACDTGALQRDRDQLWAEAYHRYCQGETWHLSIDQEALAIIEQAARVEVDDWEESVLAYAEGKERVTTKVIMEDAFGWENPALWTQANSKRIGAILRRNSWRHKSYRDDGGNFIKGFVRVTDPTGHKPPTGHKVEPNKNKVVTDVTDVASDMEFSQERKTEENNNTHDMHSIALHESDGHTGHTGHIGHTGSKDHLPSPQDAPTIAIPTPVNGTHEVRYHDARPCRACGGTRYWTSPYGATTCAKCHPQPLKET